MTSGRAITHAQWRQALRLLRESYREGSRMQRSEIAAAVGMHRHTLRQMIDRAAIKYLEEVESAERHADLRLRAFH